MSKKHSKPSTQTEQKQSRWALPMIGLVALAFIVGIIFLKQQGSSDPKPVAPTGTAGKPETIEAPPNDAPAKPVTRPAYEIQSMQVNKAVVVTAELDFGLPVPSISQALTEIDRHYEPADGQGRTFAILDAYGDPTADGKLHISMHVSSEKPGRGSLLFRRNGQVLWNSNITPVPGASPAKELTVYIADGKGASWMVDGSGGAKSILDAKLRERADIVRVFWPEGAEREVTFVYSACGCPVKVMARRVGDRTERTRDLPVIFPDDPAAVSAISSLMKW